METLTENRGLLKYIILQILTLGIYGFYLIHRQAKESNLACHADSQHTRGLLGYLVLSAITFGIYPIVWHCSWISRCNNYLTRSGQSQGLQISTYLLTLFFFGPLTLGIMYFVVRAKMLYLQNNVNRMYNLALA
jgi:hypothetical protein